MPVPRSLAASQVRRVKRVYADLVRRRSRVYVVEAREPTLENPPIFVAGLFRSGTTLLRYVLDSHSRIACGPETNFLGSLASIIEDERAMAGFEGLGFDRASVINRQRRFVASFYEDYARAHGKRRWADKSPNYVDHLDYIAELFPEAQFLLITRHPLDQIHSHTRGGTLTPEHLLAYGEHTEHPLTLGARYWEAQTQKLLAFEEAHPGRCHRLRYETLSLNPEPTVRTLFAFLNEVWEPQVLRFWEFDHDAGLEDDRIRTTTGFDLHADGYRSWPPEAVTQVWGMVKDAARALEYSAPTSISGPE